MPQHRHQLMSDSSSTTASVDTYALTDHKVESTATGANYRELDMIDYTGNSECHNNLTPYISVFIFKRLT